MAYRSSVPDLARPERDRLDRDRFQYERDREDDRDRYSEIRERFEGVNDHVYSRVPPRVPSRPPAREPSERRYRRYEDEEDDFHSRERRRVTYDDEPRYERRRPSPPESDMDRHSVFIQRERQRVRSPSPPRRRPAQMVRRQSSLDTFDRKPIRHYDRDYSPPARRGDYRIPPNVPIPLPRSKALPPPRVYSEKGFFDDIRIAEPRRFDGDEYRAPERIREKEVIRERRRRSRSRSRSSRGTSRRSRSSSSSSSSSSSGGTALTAKSEYPKKGKTRIPARLVSKRALIELGYPYTEEGNVIIVQKALGQQNIDDLLKMSDEFKKSELEILAARSSAGDIVEERRAEIIEVAPPRQQHSGAVVVAAPAAPTVEFVKTATVREVSPARSYATTSYDSTTSYDTITTSTSSGTTTTITPVIVDARHPHPVGGEIVLAERPHHHHHSHSRSRSRHSRHGSRDIVRAERLSTGELVLYEEQVERVEEPSRGVRIEKDRKGRMSISVPKYR